MKRHVFRLVVSAGFLFSLSAIGQNQPATLVGQQISAPSSAAEFLLFTPDARSGALGDAGVALPDADANAIHWNPSRLIFARQNAGASVSYTPWLRDLVDDMYYTDLAGYKKLGRNQVIGGSFRYFDLGSFNATTPSGQPAGSFNSREYAITGSYSRRLSDNLALGINLKFLSSNLVGGNITVNGQAIRPGNTAAGDIGLYYQDVVRDNSTGRGLGWSFGAMISNLGGRINYGGEQRFFIPANLRLGGGLTYYVDEVSKFNFVLDFNKLMVPTPPVYGPPVNGVRPIIAGQDPNRPYFSATFGSFADAPGGFAEELREITLSTGVEYWYDDVLAARVGFFNEARDKGNRKFATAGVGLRLKDRYGLDFSYLIPISTNSPLANSLRLSLLINLNARPAEEE